MDRMNCRTKNWKGWSPLSRTWSKDGEMHLTVDSRDRSRRWQLGFCMKTKVLEESRNLLGLFVGFAWFKINNFFFQHTAHITISTHSHKLNWVRTTYAIMNSGPPLHPITPSPEHKPVPEHHSVRLNKNEVCPLSASPERWIHLFLPFKAFVICVNPLTPSILSCRGNFSP